MQILRGTAFLAITMAMILSGCGGPTIDGTSDETFQASAEVVKASLPEEDRLQFDKALQGFEYLFSENAIATLNNKVLVKERLRTRLSGHSGQEVLDLWDERLTKSIRTLEENKANMEAALEELKVVQVQSAKFKIQRNGQRVAEIKVKNGTEYTISRIYFNGVLTSRGHRKPWAESAFNYKETLEAGESVTWAFALLDVVWERVPEDRKDYNFKVTVTRIDDEEGEPIYDAYSNPFTKRDQERLETLKNFQSEHVEDNVDTNE